MFCSNCGTHLNADSVFCGNCGTPVVQTPVVTPEPVLPPGPVTATPEPAVAAPEPADVVAESVAPEPVAPETAAMAPDPGLTVPLPVQHSAWPVAAPEAAPGMTAPMPQMYGAPPAPLLQQPPADAYPGYAPAPPDQMYGAPYGAPPAPPAKSASTTPLLIGVGVVIALAVAGFVLWQNGSLNGLIGGGSKTPTSTVAATGGGTGNATTTPLPPAEETTTALPEEPDTTTLSESDSYDAMVSEWETIGSLRAEFGEKFPGSSKGVGWIYTTWSKRIGMKSSRPDREALAVDAEAWVDRIGGSMQTFEELQVSPAYSMYKDRLVRIYELLSERAAVYAATTDYAVDHPTISKGNEPWRAVQDGELGGSRAASDVLADLQSAAADYTPPDAP